MKQCNQNKSAYQVFAWLRELASNFRLHYAVVLVAAIFANVLFIGNAIINVICMIVLLFVLFPGVMQRKKHNNEKYIATIKTCSFNIQWNIDCHNQCLEFISESDSDFIVVQEVTSLTQDAIETFKNIYPYQYGSGHSHVMVLSKHEMKFVGYLSWPGKFQHRALHLTFEYQSKTIHIIAIHMQVIRTWKQLKQRNDQVTCLVNTLRNITGPVIVIGDFNAAVGSRSINKIKANTNLTGNGNIFKYIPTWPSSMGKLGIQLDHILIRESLAIKNIYAGPSMESDHRPLIAEIAIND